VNHIGFTPKNKNIEITPKDIDIDITPRHKIEGREYPTLQATTIFAKYPKNFEARELKALILLQILSEVSAGPKILLKTKYEKQQIQALVDDTCKNIDAERAPESGFSFNPLKMLAGFFGK
jgi:hypothetical protein